MSGLRGGANDVKARRQLVVVVSFTAVIAMIVTLAAVIGTLTPASHPKVSQPSRVLADDNAPVVLDLATGQTQVELDGINSQVDAQTYGDVQPVQLSSGTTMLVNKQSGNFNLLEPDNYVLDRTGGGVALGDLSNSTSATGVADGNAAFIVRSAPQSTVSLVDSGTVQQVASNAQLTSSSSSSKPEAPHVMPRGFAQLQGSVPSSAGAEMSANGVLYTVVDEGGKRDIVAVHPAGSTTLGQRTVTSVGQPNTPTVLQSPPPSKSKTGPVAMSASPGSVRLIDANGNARQVSAPRTAGATSILPAGTTAGKTWWMFKSGSGWSFLGADAAGHLTGPVTTKLPKDASLTPPAAAGGSLYMSQQEPSGTPALWQVDTRTGKVSTLPGMASYPNFQQKERPDFSNNYVVAATPGEVIYDNPGSVLGVVVFTGAKPKVVTFNKANGLEVSAIGADVVKDPNGHGNGPGGGLGPGQGGGNGNVPHPQPNPQQNIQQAPNTTSPNTLPAAVQTINQNSCDNPNQIPHVPSINQVTPAAETAMVVWNYPLLSPQDCLPTSWSISVKALNNAPQPANPEQIEYGQDQYTFTGLRPNTQYQVTVTAYIGSHSTASGPSQFSTKDEGANPPSNVHTVFSNGNWVVTWQPCKDSSCVSPAAQWNITGAACGRSNVPQPPSQTVDGGQNTVSIPADSFNGQSLSFSVQGVTASNLPGSPAGDNECTSSGPPPGAAPPGPDGGPGGPGNPNGPGGLGGPGAPGKSGGPGQAHPDKIQITWSFPDQLGTSVNLNINQLPDPNYGTNTPDFTFQINGPNGPISQRTYGNTFASFSGLTPGTSYTPQVSWTSDDGTPHTVVSPQPFTTPVLNLGGGGGPGSGGPGGPGSGGPGSGGPGGPHQLPPPVLPPPPQPAPAISVTSAGLYVNPGNPNTGYLQVQLSPIPPVDPSNITVTVVYGATCGTGGPAQNATSAVNSSYTAQWTNINLVTFGNNCTMTFSFNVKGSYPQPAPVSKAITGVPAVKPTDFMIHKSQKYVSENANLGGSLYGSIPQGATWGSCSTKTTSSVTKQNSSNPNTWAVDWQAEPQNCINSKQLLTEADFYFQYAGANQPAGTVMKITNTTAGEMIGPPNNLRLDAVATSSKPAGRGSGAGGVWTPWTLLAAVAGLAMAFNTGRRRRRSEARGQVWSDLQRIVKRSP